MHGTAGHARRGAGVVTGPWFWLRSGKTYLLVVKGIDRNLISIKQKGNNWLEALPRAEDRRTQGVTLIGDKQMVVFNAPLYLPNSRNLSRRLPDLSPGTDDSFINCRRTRRQHGCCAEMALSLRGRCHRSHAHGG